MTKRKKVLSLLLIIVLGGYILYKLLFSTSELTIKDRKISNNPAEKVILTDGIYTVGIDLKKGFYDVKVLSNKVIMDGDILSKGDQLINQVYYNRNEVTIKGNGKVLFKPSKFKSLAPNKNGQIVIKGNSNFIVGTDIPAGDYILNVKKTPGRKEPFIFIQILSSFKESNKLVSTVEFKTYNKEKKIHLKDGQLIQINKKPFQNQPNTSILILSKK